MYHGLNKLFEGGVPTCVTQQLVVHIGAIYGRWCLKLRALLLPVFLENMQDSDLLCRQ